MFLDALRWETRSGIFGTYVQRNTMIVIGMSFTIIPLIFTSLKMPYLASLITFEMVRSGQVRPMADNHPDHFANRSKRTFFSYLDWSRVRGNNDCSDGGRKYIHDGLEYFQRVSNIICHDSNRTESNRGSTHFRILFLTVLLFVLTFFINTVAELVRQRFRRRSNEL